MEGRYILPNPETLEAMPLEELKLETDARAAIFIGAFKSFALTDNTQDIFIDWVKRDNPDNMLEDFSFIELAEHFKETAPLFFDGVLGVYTNQFKQTESGQQFLEEFNMYRNAYFKRSPAAEDKERHYGSIQDLIFTGFVTGLMHIRGLMSRQDAAAIFEGMSVDETESLIGSSSHLALWVSKLSLADEERYLDISNNVDVNNNSVQIVDGVYSFSPDLQSKMRQTASVDPRIAHRPHLQCPASISFPGERSFNSDFWAWYNGALAKADFWNKQK